MKKKVGTLIEEMLLDEAKKRAAREGRSLAEIIQHALIAYLRQDVATGDALRACRNFCAHGGLLKVKEIEELLEEDMLSV